jgi:hypothetical protein
MCGVKRVVLGVLGAVAAHIEWNGSILLRVDVIDCDVRRVSGAAGWQERSRGKRGSGRSERRSSERGGHCSSGGQCTCPHFLGLWCLLWARAEAFALRLPRPPPGAGESDRPRPSFRADHDARTSLGQGRRRRQLAAFQLQSAHFGSPQTGSPPAGCMLLADLN